MSVLPLRRIKPIIFIIPFLLSMQMHMFYSDAADGNYSVDTPLPQEKNQALEKIFIDLSDEAVGRKHSLPRKKEIKSPNVWDQKKLNDFLTLLRSLYRDRKYLVSGPTELNRALQESPLKDNQAKQVVSGPVSSTPPNKRNVPGYLRTRAREANPPYDVYDERHTMKEKDRDRSGIRYQQPPAR